MARREVLNAILQSFKKLGGNVNDVLGTKTNVNFLGKGKSPELMLDMDINEEALAVLPQSKAIEELTSSVGYAVAGKLNDIQANKLLSNMQKMENVYFPPAAPANITDLATGTRNLDKEGLMSLRRTDDLPPGDPDLPPPGSRGEPGDVAAPFASAEETITNLAKAPTGEGLEAIKNVKNNNLIINDLVNKIYLNAGVAENAQPVVRANARDFLNRIKDLTDEPGNPALSDIMEADDFKFMTEGGGGGMGDPFLLVQKYFGPKVAAAIAKLDGPNDIQLFAERLISIKDAKGKGVTDRFFDPESVDISDFEFADGGRVPFSRGGGADAADMFIPPKFLTMKGISEDPSLKVGGFGLDKHDAFYDKFGKFLNPLYFMEKFLEKRNRDNYKKNKKADGGIIRRDGYMAGMLVRGGKMGYQALRKYGIEGKDISRLFASLGSDKSLAGKEKTAYFQQLHKVLRNPDAFPDEIMDIQKQLGLDVGLGFRNGGLAGILEV